MSDIPLKELARDSRGYRLYVETTELGRRYWSDEIGGGVMVWDTALVSLEMLRLALHEEELCLKTEYTNLNPNPQNGNKPTGETNASTKKE